MVSVFRRVLFGIQCFMSPILNKSNPCWRPVKPCFHSVKLLGLCCVRALIIIERYIRRLKTEGIVVPVGESEVD